jgi:5-methylcytosine-specific restriction endonuclease McrA
MSQVPRRAVLVAAIGSLCPLCGEPMAGPDRFPTRDHIKPRSKGHRLTADNRAIICARCNKAKGSLSLQRFANRLARTGDPRAEHVAAFIVWQASVAGNESSTAITARAVFRPVESN